MFKYTFACIVILLFVNAQFLPVRGQSEYTEKVIIPEYDPDNSEHFFINSKEDWTHINDEDKRFFYVEPNLNYGTITIFADGTKYRRRYISLYNRNDLHPARLPIAEQANVSLVFDSAHYWVVDRMSSISLSQDYCHIVGAHSSNIVLNRLYLTEFIAGILIRGASSHPYTENITVQNCRFDRMSDEGIDRDKVAIMLTGHKWDQDRTIYNTKILNNEIKNCNDGIMLIRHPEKGHKVNYAGTIIDNNHIYVDQEVYTDGNGNHNPDGLWALTENAIDLKGGSEDPEHPVIISKNHLWGYRKTDQNRGGSGSWGSAIVGHYHVKNVILSNNIIFNSNRGIAFGDPAGLPYSVENANICENILFDIGHDSKGNIRSSNFFYNSKNVKFHKNTIVGITKQSRWFSLNNEEQDMDVTSNVIIESYQMSGTRSPSTTIASNIYYNTEIQNIQDGKYFNNSSDAKMKDLTFTTDRFTNNPREITLHGVVTTSSSPHASEDTLSISDTSASEDTLSISDKNVEIELLQNFPNPFNESTENVEIELLQNFPNPFNESTTIQYSIPETSFVKLIAFKMTGERVALLVSEVRQAGWHQIIWESDGYAEGVYVCKLITEASTLSRRMILTR